MSKEWTDHKEDMHQQWLRARVEEVVALGCYVEVDIMDRLHIMCSDQEQLDALIAWMDINGYKYHTYAEYVPIDPLNIWSDLIEHGSQHVGFVSWYAANFPEV